MIGSWLARRLLDAGAEVVALVLDHDPQSELVRSGTIDGCRVVNGALQDYDAVERAVVVHDVDTVFHLGAQTLVGAAHRAPLATFEANIQGTWNVLEAARRHGGTETRVVVASSDKAYGEHDDLPYTEDTRLAPQHPYEVSKSCADLLSHTYAATYGMATVVARCGNVYGGGDLNWSRIVPGTIRALLHGTQPVIRSDGTFKRDYLFVDDVVDAYLALADGLDRLDIAGSAFNFSDESPRTVLEIYAAVCDAMGAGDVEPAILDAAVGEIKDQYLDASRARAALGWKCRYSLEDGLRDTVAWYRAHADLAAAR
jgi:CDP-glucose 4,6-dehydratase